MKFMGSKRALLGNGLGELLQEELAGVESFADLFCGSAAVSWFAAEKSPSKVLSSDLQNFSIVLSRAVIGRTEAIDPGPLFQGWQSQALEWLGSSPLWRQASRFESLNWGSARRRNSDGAKILCAKAPVGTVMNAYGGYYFSPKQALLIDAHRATLPGKGPDKDVALASLISAAAYCCASPGHTAQPFRASKGSAPFLFEAWRRDLEGSLEGHLKEICAKHALTLGVATVGDAVMRARSLRDVDLAFVDPPYSAVHYSRFYHVLETIAVGTKSKVSGEGRYPPPEERPRSRFSVPTRSEKAMRRLLKGLGENGTRTIVTFPKRECSNGLSEEKIAQLAREWFRVRQIRKISGFSTLGGNRSHREAKESHLETILILEPRH